LASASYLSTPSEFFSAFDEPWERVEGQILKLETRQHYREVGNPGYEALQSGDLTKAVRLIPDIRQDDLDLYRSLLEKKVDFIRCRPIIKPLSTYLQWELECYKWNEAHGERIYLLDRSSIFDNYALHDFMVFDRFVAFIHDYGAEGEIRGGWVVNEEHDVDALIKLFSIVKASSVYYTKFPIE
jgi:hypothetical protein